MSVSLKTVKDGITVNLKGLLDRGRAMQSFLNTNIYQMYQNIQRERWMTENASETEGWKSLSTKYAAYKLKKYAGSEYGGDKMLIATGDLFKAVIGPGSGQRKMVTNTKLYISTDIPYAGYVDEKRNFTNYGQDSKDKFNNAIKDFVFFNIKRGVS